ncbi:putative metallophosphoesterase [uncultured Blautia sp.]
MKTFRIKKYEIVSSKIKEGEIRFAFLSDLHGLEFGEDNSELLHAVRGFSPDAVLCTGDMLVRSHPDTLGTAQKLLGNLAEEFPVYLSLGNHEYKLLVSEAYESMRETYKAYEQELEAGGIHILHNQYMEATIKENRIGVYGLELPLCYYDKFFSQKLTEEEITGFLGERKKEFSILLAHNPRYGKSYFSWGADLILSGHYHGGVVRFGENIGLVSSHFRIFPPFCCGKFTRGEQNMIVSAGLGEHTIPVRFHNPRELICITVKSPKEDVLWQYR